MSARRKPLDDAKRRVNEKLNAIEEQTEFIQQSVSQLITGVSCLKKLRCEEAGRRL